MKCCIRRDGVSKKTKKSGRKVEPIIMMIISLMRDERQAFCYEEEPEGLTFEKSTTGIELHSSRTVRVSRPAGKVGRI